MPYSLLVDPAHAASHTKMDLLPAELLRQIFILIAGDGSDSLLAVCKVNRRFYRIASSLLVRSWRYDRRADLGGFIRHLLRHPELRTEIRELKLRHILKENAWSRIWESWDAPMSTCPPPIRSPPTISGLDMADKSYIVKQLLRHVERSDPVLVQLRLGVPDALCVFLIFWAVNLEHLDVAIPTDGGSLEIIQCLEKTPKIATSTSWAFQRLDCVSLKGDSTTRHVDGQQIAPVLRLPRLATLRLARLSLEHLDQAPEGRGAGEHFPRGTSPLERLIITKCRVTSLGLTVLTSACERLKHLDLTWHRGLGKILQPERALLSALPPSLESIKLGDNNSDFKTDRWLAFHEYLMEDAANFPCLEEINMWDIPISKRYYDTCTAQLVAKYAPTEGPRLLLHDPECDSVYKIHIAKGCKCYWTLKQRQRYENRKRRGQI